jgi:hypothetical protein
MLRIYDVGIKMLEELRLDLVLHLQLDAFARTSYGVASGKVTFR